MLLTTDRHHTVNAEEFFADAFTNASPGEVLRWLAPEDFSPEAKDKIFRSENAPDVYTPLQRGKEWLFELTLQEQPRTGRLLCDGGPLMVRVRPLSSFTQDSVNILFDFGLEVQGKFVRVYRRFWGYNPSDLDARDNQEWLSEMKFYRSLPKALARAYYHRFDGLDLPWPPSFSLDTWMLPRPSGFSWPTFDHFLRDRYHGYKTKYLPWFDARFPHLKPKRKSDPYFDFRCILETLPCDMTRRKRDVLRSGIDSLWIEIGEKESPVYLITNGEVDKMRVLIDPVEAIDLYCEHVLLNRLEPFDFHQFSRPLD